jgi:hypothetical protein
MRVLLYGRVAFGIAALGAFTMWQSTQMPARAQLLDQLKGITGSGHEGGALPGLGGGYRQSIRRAQAIQQAYCNIVCATIT